MKIRSEVCKNLWTPAYIVLLLHLVWVHSTSLLYCAQQPGFTRLWFDNKAPRNSPWSNVQIVRAICMAPQVFLPGTVLFSWIPGTYSEAPAGYPQGFGITCGRCCMKVHFSTKKITFICPLKASMPNLHTANSQMPQSVSFTCTESHISHIAIVEKRVTRYWFSLEP